MRQYDQEQINVFRGPRLSQLWELLTPGQPTDSCPDFMGTPLGSLKSVALGCSLVGPVVNPALNMIIVHGCGAKNAKMYVVASIGRNLSLKYSAPGMQTSPKNRACDGLVD
jgi:hypothetical protein